MTTSTPGADSADYIAKSAHTGRWQWTKHNRNIRTGTFTAGQLAAHFAPQMAAGAIEINIMTVAPYTVTHSLIHRERFVPQPDGSLAGYSANGTRTVIHPADRKLTVLC